MKQEMRRGHYKTASQNSNRSGNLHQSRTKGFSLAEAMVLLTIFCMVFILGLQWYLNRPMNQTAGFWSGLRAAFTVASPMETSQATLDGEQTSGADMIIDDDAIAAGVPALLAEQNALVLQFGPETSGVSLHVPGRVIVSQMPVATTDEMADIHWFYPE